MKKKYLGIIEKVVLVLAPLILFSRYVFGGEVYLFNDIGGDSMFQTYPGLYRAAMVIADGNVGEYFFSDGFGNWTGPVSISLSNWMAFFGTEDLALLFGISIFVKTVLSGLLAYFWMYELGIKDYLRLIVALGYEFNAMLTVRSPWVAYPNIALLVMLWLYAFELIFKKLSVKRMILFSMVNVLFVRELGGYYFVLYGAVFFVYVLFRCATEGKGKKAAFGYSGSFLLLYVLCGYIFGETGSILASAKSSRVTAGINTAANSVGVEAAVSSNHNAISTFSNIQWGNLLDSFERCIGQAIQGVSDDYCIGYDLLEGLAFYFGILCFVLVPVAFYNLPKIKKFILGVGLFISFLVIASRKVRMLSTGFTGDTFKYNTFWIVLLLLLILAEGYLNAVNTKPAAHSLMVFNISVALCFVLLIMLIATGRVARMGEWWKSIAYLSIYAICINGIVLGGYKWLVWIILGAVCTEGVVLSYSLVNDRGTYSIEELQKVFFDDAYYAHRYVTSKDDTLFRIEKAPINYMSFCESKIQDYYGTLYYIGGEGVDPGVLNLYQELKLPNSGIRWMYGTSGNIYANSFLGVKYVYLNNQLNTRYGMEKTYNYNNVDVYRNTLALPFVYYNDSLISKNDLEKLDVLQRNRAMATNTVVEDAAGIYPENNIENMPGFKRSQHIDSTGQSSFGIDCEAGDVVVIIPDVQDDQREIYDIHWDSGKGIITCQSKEGHGASINFSYGGFIEMYCEEHIESVRFDGKTAALLNGIDIYIFDSKEYYREISDDINKLQKTAMKDLVFTGNEITGTLYADKDGMIVTSIPMGKWQLFVDGDLTPLETVNFCFIGAKVKSGEHNIRLVYEQDK